MVGQRIGDLDHVRLGEREKQSHKALCLTPLAKCGNALHHALSWGMLRCYSLDIMSSVRSGYVMSTLGMFMGTPGIDALCNEQC